MSGGFTEIVHRENNDAQALSEKRAQDRAPAIGDAVIEQPEPQEMASAGSSNFVGLAIDDAVPATPCSSRARP